MTEIVYHVKTCDIYQKAKPSPKNTQPLQTIRTTEPFELNRYHRADIARKQIWKKFRAGYDLSQIEIS